ncbi:MAG: hypothetical protein VCA36_09015 [Opitutales bacterium]
MVNIYAQADSSSIDVDALPDTVEGFNWVPGVVHGAIGQMRVLVIGIPDIDDSDVYYPE